MREVKAIFVDVVVGKQVVQLSVLLLVVRVIIVCISHCWHEVRISFVRLGIIWNI